ncbi:ABC transporter permease [Streptomyces sp. NPDC004539]|uniref:ABC transporter permease n=1 Tax=Streptomyces sp. NPDC004539 TaxID=3154280 RepID=UPI0033A51562
MTRYLLRRLVSAALVLWAAFTGAFLLLFIVPGDPVEMMLGQEALDTTPPAQIAALKAEFGTDRPLAVQYADQLWRLLHLDLGTSFQQRVPVADLLGGALPSTLQLAACALVLGVVLGVTLAVLIQAAPYPWLRAFLDSLPVLGVSMPSFWTGLILLQLLSFRWDLFPAFGDQGANTLVLPSITLAIPLASVTAQVLSTGIATTLAEPYVQQLRAKGVSPVRLHLRHVLRNASLPTLTTVGVWTAQLLGGAVLTETVFSRHGLGQTAELAVSSRDIPVVQGIVLLSAAVFVTVNLAVDLLYGVVDPRVRIREVTA